MLFGIKRHCQAKNTSFSVYTTTSEKLKPGMVNQLAHRAECSWFLLEQDIRSVKRILTNGKYSVPLKWFLDVKWEHFCISLGIILPLIAPEREFDARWNSAINLILIKRFFYIFFGFKWQLQNISLKNLLYTSLGIGFIWTVIAFPYSQVSKFNKDIWSNFITINLLGDNRGK